MTKEEVLAMNPSMQMGELVATEVMRWRREGDHWVTPEGFWRNLWGLDGWHPFCDISAAWDVLQELRKEHWCIEIKIADGCQVIMELLKTPPIRVEVNGGTTFEQLPAVICKAALITRVRVC